MNIETGKIYNEDCMETMERMGENDIDLVLTDPPYGIGESGQTNHTRGKLAESYDYSGKNWDNERISNEYIDKVFNVSNNQIIFGGNYYTDILPPSMGWIIWDKDNGDTDFADCEMCWTSFEKATRQYEWKWQGMLQEDMGNKDEKYHPTQKPTGLIKLILQDWVEDDWTIYDPFTGSGSIPVACEELGFEWVASEKDEDYVQKARKRIKREREQEKLF